MTRHRVPNQSANPTNHVRIVAEEEGRCICTYIALSFGGPRAGTITRHTFLPSPTLTYAAPLAAPVLLLGFAGTTDQPDAPQDVVKGVRARVQPGAARGRRLHSFRTGTWVWVSMLLSSS